MNLYQLEKEFDQFYFNLWYDEAMQTVGKMKMGNHTSKARYCELLIYYEQGKYEKVRQMLRNKKINSVEERELYICSLLELQLYDEFYKAYKTLGVVSRYCVAYIGGIMISQGISVEKIKELGNIKALEDYPTYMERRYRWFVAKTMADIYLLNEEKIQMIDANMDKEDISHLEETIDRKFESIRINDLNREEIKKLVDSNLHIELDKILWFPVKYCSKKDINGRISPIQSFDNLYDILNYLEICRKIDYESIVISDLMKYGQKLFDAVQAGNVYVVDLMKKIYLDVSFYTQYEKDENNETIADKIYAHLRKYAPYVVEDLEEHSNDRSVLSVLTDKGQFAYKAALWQFEHSMNSNYGTMDAGMLCLSYMRILELEINEKLIKKVQSHRDEITQKYQTFISGFQDEEKKKHEGTWSYIINSINKTDKKTKQIEALELGSVAAILDILRDKKFKKSNPDFYMTEQLKGYFKKYLTEDGIEALNKGVLADMIKPSLIKKYRNPPAHTRYVRLEVALECREHVNENLILLNRCIKSDK